MVNVMGRRYADNRVGMSSFGSSENASFMRRHMRKAMIVLLGCVLAISGVFIAKLSTDVSGNSINVTKSDNLIAAIQEQTRDTQDTLRQEFELNEQDLAGIDASILDNVALASAYQDAILQLQAVDPASAQFLSGLFDIGSDVGDNKDTRAFVGIQATYTDVVNLVATVAAIAGIVIDIYEIGSAIASTMPVVAQLIALAVAKIGAILNAIPVYGLIIFAVFMAAAVTLVTTCLVRHTGYKIGVDIGFIYVKGFWEFK